MDEETKDLYESNSYFNKKSIAEEEIRRISEKIKLKNPQIKITHVLDREFDDDENFSLINELQDKFVIRSKKSRLEKADDKTKAEKLIEKEFSRSFERQLQRVSFKDRVVWNLLLKADSEGPSFISSKAFSICQSNLLSHFIPLY